MAARERLLEILWWVLTAGVMLWVAGCSSSGSAVLPVTGQGISGKVIDGYVSGAVLSEIPVWTAGQLTIALDRDASEGSGPLYVETIDGCG